MDPINPDTTMDAVTLRVGDLEGMSSYYGQSLALTPLEERTRGREVHRVLGRGTTPMVRLDPHSRPAGGGPAPGGAVPHRLPVR